mgnify:CR=1 FL=1
MNRFWKNYIMILTLILLVALDYFVCKWCNFIVEICIPISCLFGFLGGAFFVGMWNYEE